MNADLEIYTAQNNKLNMSQLERNRLITNQHAIQAYRDGKVDIQNVYVHNTSKHESRKDEQKYIFNSPYLNNNITNA